jgi:moderate conductance mechanosensitive channel
MAPGATSAIAFDTATLLIRVGIIVIVAFAVSRIAAILIGRIERTIKSDPRGDAIEREKRAQTLGQVLRSASWVLIVVVGALMAVRELGLDITPALAAAGGFGVAAGLGAQTLIRDVIGGFFVLMENQFAVGDVVRVAGVAGKVEALTFRHTEVRDGDGALHFIPNGEMKVVTNLSKAWSQPTVRVPISSAEDPVRVMRVIEEEISAFREDPSMKPHLDGPPKLLGIEELYPGYFTVLIQAKTHPGRRLEVGRSLRMAVLRRLGAERISMRQAGAADVA